MTMKSTSITNPRRPSYEPPQITTVKTAELLEAIGPAVAVYGLGPNEDPGW